MSCCEGCFAFAGNSQKEDIPLDKLDPKSAKYQNQLYKQTLDFLQKVPLFRRLPKDQLPFLAAACNHPTIRPRQVIIKQGEIGNEFFVVKTGEATVSVTNPDGTTKEVASLKGGDYFGELALLRDEPRAATVTAKTEMQVLSITREKFTGLCLSEKLRFVARKAVGGGGKRLVETKPPSSKTKQERELITKALKGNYNLREMVTLDQARIDHITDVAWKETIPAGQEIITRGDLIADYFYIVQEGAFEIYAPAAEGEEPQCVQKPGKGDSFGELALLYLVPRAATVKAMTNSVVWVIDRMSFKSILMKVSDKKIEEYVKHLNGVEILASLLQEEKQTLAKALAEVYFEKNEVILQQGNPGSTFYIMYDGKVEVTKDGKVQTTLSADKSTATAMYFGERALLHNEPRAATVRAVSATVKALALDRDSFNLLLGPLEDLMSRDESDKPVTRTANNLREQANSVKKGRRIARKGLKKIGLLGCGGFGAVELWEEVETGETFAMKMLSKGYVVKTGMQESVMTERDILLSTNSPFIIKLHETYNEPQTLSFLLEAALGGELFETYNRMGFHGKEQHARFYSAGVVFAFDHLHERRIIYRDLKPENLLLTDEGRVKITDMGLARFVIGKTFTTCGTPDYFAPELIASLGHNAAVDWWTLGILIYELIVGSPPFEADTPMQTYGKVMRGISRVNFPRQAQGDIGVLVKGLLCADPSSRLCMRPGGSNNLKEHAWYKGFDWDAMFNQTMPVPYKPNVKSKKDIANFFALPADMPPQIKYHDDGSGWDKDFAT